METLFVGTNLFELDCIPSTNSFLLDLSKHKSLPEGTLVWAKDQNAGRGQQGNSWEVSPNQNLTFSIILYPKFVPIAKQFVLSKMVALSIYDYLQDCLSEVSIKWPNDIYVGKKKIAGVLIENTIDHSGINQTIIGIGLNVNQINFPEGLSHATSIKACTKIELDLKVELEKLCKQIEKNYLRLKTSVSAMDKAYSNRLYLREVWANYKDKDGVFEAKIIGVDGGGKLQLEDRSKMLRTYNLQEISYL